MIPLYDAQTNSCYRILSISPDDLAKKMSIYGIYKNSMIQKVEPDELRYATLKFRTKDGTFALMGHMAKRLFVRTIGKVVSNIYEMEEGKTVILDHIQGHKKIQSRLKALGLAPGRRIKIQRKLPFMQYRILINGKVKATLSEAIVSTIIGTGKQDKTQLSFARRNQPFFVTQIIAGQKITSYLNEIGILEGAEITLLGIEPGKQVVFDENASIAIHVLEGYRLMISKETASKIMVA